MNTQLIARALGAAILLSAGASALPGQTRQTSPNSEKVAVIRQILVVTNAADMMLVGIEAGLPAQRAANPNIPAAFWDRFAARVRNERGTLIDSLVPIYDRLFNVDELKELLRFYQTPFGKRFIAASPDLARESILAGQRWGFVIGQEIGAQLQREGLVPRPPDEER